MLVPTGQAAGDAIKGVGRLDGREETSALMKFDLIAPLLPKSLPLVDLTLCIPDALSLVAGSLDVIVESNRHDLVSFGIEDAHAVQRAQRPIQFYKVERLCIIHVDAAFEVRDEVFTRVRSREAYVLTNHAWST